MTKIEYNNIKDWFLSYSENFLNIIDIDSENIKLKINHTLRVCKNMDLISKDLTENDKLIALTVALLHDVGRFEQLRIYGTFSDAISEDHASLGIKILKELGVLDNLELFESEIIYIAIENHNKAKIVSGLSIQTLKIAKLVRDADKLDIWRVVIEYYKDGREKSNPSLVHNLPYGTDICSPVYNAVKEKGIIKYKILETVIDMKIFQMAWIFDINTNYALSLILERGYLEGIFNTLPKTERIKNLYGMMKEYLVTTTLT